jgi:hypothetical protein
LKEAAILDMIYEAGIRKQDQMKKLASLS